nr:Bor family protein [Spirosoma panaciterrae]
MTSCFVYNVQVGKGAQGNVQIKQKNHYLIAGLVALKQSDPKAMAGGSVDYTVTLKHSFVDYLLSGITFSIYSPTTTVVTK